MIHFFPTFSNDASQSPLALELKELNISHILFSEKISLCYKNRLWLIFIGWPKILFFAIRSARRSFFKTKIRASSVVLGSDIETIVFAIIRALTFRRKLRIVLIGFIYTNRSSKIISKLRILYFNIVLSFTDIVICHSRIEVETYQKLFNWSKTKFKFIPFGMNVAGRSNVYQPKVSHPYILAAGRSGRDYATLIEAVRGTDLKLHIVCDRASAVKGIEIPNNVIILKNSYGGDYLAELYNSSIVAIPLCATDISAGQMVMLQAMAFGKPVVVTNTPTITDYVTSGVDAILVQPGNVDAMRSVLENLMNSPETRASIGSAGLYSFETKYNMRSLVRNLIFAIK